MPFPLIPAQGSRLEGHPSQGPSPLLPALEEGLPRETDMGHWHPWARWRLVGRLEGTQVLETMGALWVPTCM